mgnify:CR=1 FL=1
MSSKSEKAKAKKRMKMIHVSKEINLVEIPNTGILVPVGHKPGTTYKKDENLSDPS